MIQPYFLSISLVSVSLMQNENHNTKYSAKNKSKMQKKRSPPKSHTQTFLSCLFPRIQSLLNTFLTEFNLYARLYLLHPAYPFSILLNMKKENEKIRFKFKNT